MRSACRGSCRCCTINAQLPFREDPRDLFRHLLPGSVIDDHMNPPGIIPDFHADLAMPRAIDHRPRRGGPAPRQPHWQREALPTRRLLFDVKTVWGGGQHYQGAWARHHQSGAVESRALGVDSQYRTHARILDSRHSRPMLPGTTVPDMSQPAGDQVQRALAQFGQVRGLVFGQYGEWSHDVSSLVSLAAARTASRIWRGYGARSEAEVRGMMTALYRRRLGLIVARAFARFRIARLALVGVPRGTLDRFRADRLRDQQRGPRGTELAIGMSDLLAFASHFQAHAPEGVLAA